METVAILGIGAMGSRIAHNILKAGYNLNVWNRTESKCRSLVNIGARVFSTPRDAVQGATIVISIVTDDEASKDVWCNNSTGAMLNIDADSIAIESSTISLSWCKQLAKEMGEHQIPFLDAPILGSRPQAEASQLIYLVGGEAETLDKASKLLATSASAVHHVGESGSAITMKLIVNGLLGIQVSALSEALGVLAKLGYSNQQSIELLNQLPITSQALKGIGALISLDDHKPLFPISLIKKDYM